jgi:hypothetical protein
VTDQIAHILLLVFAAAIPAGMVAVMLIGRARLRKQGNTAFPADLRPMGIEDSTRLDTVNSAIDRMSHRS